MKIEEYSWRNFNSYGDIENSIKFDSDSSLNLISAENGAGKTTCAEVLEFNIFGKVTNKKKTDLPNRVNRTLETRSKITTKEGLLEITRNYDPALMEIKLNGDIISDLAGKLNVQKYVEDDVLDIDHFMFKNLVVLDINKFKSFVKMTAGDKKTLIDRVFGLDILTLMAQEVKEELKSNNSNINDIQIKINELHSQIQFSEDKVDKLKIRLNEQADVEQHNLELELESIGENRKKILEKFKKLNSKLVTEQAKLNQLTSAKNGFEYELRDLKKRLSLYQKNAICPTCGSNLDSSEHNDIKNNLLEQMRLIKTQFDETLPEIDSANERLRKLFDIRDVGNKKIASFDSKISSINVELKKLEKNDYSIYMEGLVEVVNNNKKQLEIEDEKLDDKSDDVKFLTIIGNTLGESGIKKHIIDQIIPNLNNEINTFLSRLNMPYHLKLDSSLNSEVEYLGRTLSVHTLSTGENKKFDFAVLVSFIKMLKMRFCDINLLFLDEIFSSLDTESIEIVSKILKEISEELSLNIYLINHSTIDSNIFDNVMTVEKDRLGFSNLKMVE